MSDNSPIVEFIRDGNRFRIEGGRLLIRRGVVWWQMSVYREKFGEPERAENVVEFKRKATP